MQLSIFATHYSKLKLVILSLLTLNMLLFLLVGGVINAADSLVWLLLLVSYDLEAYNIQLPISNHALHQFRNILVCFITILFFGYLLQGDILAAANSLLWLALLILLELETLKPAWKNANKTTYWAATVLVFIGLIALVLIWISFGAWLDAYDAALWIAAFAIVEADLLRLMQEKLLKI
ncbi:MAG: hypothetical protein CTY19_18640 [Methylomonas sp.]|nr:MAG: hypothetical protein CTY19_18640 [Methylomonas sp.]